MRLTPSRPNPVGDDGVISYVIENALPNERSVEAVTVTMSDVYGRVVKTLPVTQIVGKEGEIPFNTADLAPGVYFWRLQTTGSTLAPAVKVALRLRHRGERGQQCPRDCYGKCSCPWSFLLRLNRF